MSNRDGIGRIVVLAVVLLALASAARADVIVVDPGGGDGSALLQAALADALDGDVVLVRAGTYTAFGAPVYYDIVGKGLTLTSDEAEPPVLGPLEIRDVPAGSTVVVRGLTLSQSAVPSSAGAPSPGLTLIDDAGAVWIEDCAIHGQDGSDLPLIGNFPGAAGAVVVNSPSVTFQRCTLTGGRGADYSAPFGFKLYGTSGGDGLSVGDESAVAAYDCVLTGGAGGNGTTFNGTESGSGGDGVSANHATLLISGCTLTGASNGANTNEFDEAGSGLSALFSESVERDSSFTPGALVAPGIAGLPVWPAPGAVGSYPALPRGFSVSGPLQEGDAGTLSIDGTPGDLVTLLVGPDAGFLPLSGKQGVLLLAPPLQLVPLGAIGPSGNLVIGFTTPNLPGSLLGVTLPLQLVVQSGDGLTLESGSAFIWLDGSL